MRENGPETQLHYSRPMETEENSNAASSERSDVRLKELRHRTSNFLNMITSMMHLKFDHLQTKEALYICTELLSMLEAYNQIFSLISSSEDSKDTFHSVTLFSKIERILTAFPLTKEQGIQIKSDIEHLELNTKFAIPLALVTIESYINTLKYAFPSENRDPRYYSIQLSTHHSQCVLLITDTGVGSNAEEDHKNKNGSGITIMRALSEQINGDFDVDFSDGTVVELRFPYR